MKGEWAASQEQMGRKKEILQGQMLMSEGPRGYSILDNLQGREFASKSSCHKSWEETQVVSDEENPFAS